ncbi:bifunctional ADP-dependent NAD(P)H-hydrate dehydratase/NAD(P)H-hydrate epimerase [Occultella glacieicola]|uniref:Bifunctional NAD(P)H-hydrate repair enzyme n=1 Tax=Occultella glacieicola TaxID=2518684 RepID=A0ABY2E7U2_9MICO|nr:NAD(P)H-hydrate dehydratase [Occultella glacieicola]TDE97633.1 bifunctional ADP-dependent NAD(P)H-hydrate dehydratase/NAD(P)H-hydrate epimerase [Occultella glacieicola]
MRLAYRAESIRAVEAPALAAGEPLMERAAYAVASAAVAEARRRGLALVGARALVLVGGGNNGGDGLFAAAYLARRGLLVTAALLRERVHPEGLAAARRAGVRLLPTTTPPPPPPPAPTPDRAAGRADAEASSGHSAESAESADSAQGVDSADRGESADRADRAELAPVLAAAEAAEIWVDAIAGIGLTGGLRGVSGEVARALNERRERSAVAPLVVAVDLPSGLEADGGAVPGEVLRADITVTMIGLKPALLLPPAAAEAGDVQVVDLGLAEAVAARPAVVRRLLDADVADLWPVPGPADHKYTRGVLGLVAGSDAYPGAAVLSSSGALRTGCGMVRYLGPAGAARMVLARHPEVVTAPGRVQAMVMGSGIAAGEPVPEAAAQAIADPGVALVVDAGGLDWLPADPTALARRRVVLTPHAGELARLLDGRGEPVERAAIEADPGRWAQRAAELTGAVVLLKGPVTVVAGPEGAWYSQADGTGWLATAGSGDVLAGIVGALLAGSDGPPAVLAAAGALVHGRAGVLAAHGAPITASDVAASVPEAIRGILAH